MKISPHLVSPIINVLYRLWYSTFRITQSGREELDRLDEIGEAALIGLWHDEFFAFIPARKTLKLCAIVSKSNDGEYLALLLNKLGIKTARGSSSRGGRSAIRQALEFMKKENRHVCITVDGPRGPRHEAKSGLFFLASYAKAPIIPARIYSERVKRLNSWDKFQIPMPFSRVHIIFGKPYYLEEKKLDSEELRKQCGILEDKLENMTTDDIFKK